jgi:hypothetical protein
MSRRGLLAGATAGGLAVLTAAFVALGPAGAEPQ